MIVGCVASPFSFHSVALSCSIPLAKKLEDCGVFGVSSDEFLNYATANRDEWALKGEAIVSELRKKYSR